MQSSTTPRSSQSVRSCVTPPCIGLKGARRGNVRHASGKNRGLLVGTYPVEQNEIRTDQRHLFANDLSGGRQRVVEQLRLHLQDAFVWFVSREARIRFAG